MCKRIIKLGMRDFKRQNAVKSKRNWTIQRLTAAMLKTERNQGRVNVLTEERKIR